MIVPGSNLIVSNGPGNGDSLFLVGLEIHLAPAIALPTPQDRSSAEPVTPPPTEGLRFCIWAVFFVGPGIHYLFLRRPSAMDHRVFRSLLVGSVSTMRKLPDILGGALIIPDVLVRCASLQ